MIHYCLCIVKYNFRKSINGGVVMTYVVAHHANVA